MYKNIVTNTEKNFKMFDIFNKTALAKYIKE